MDSPYRRDRPVRHVDFARLDGMSCSVVASPVGEARAQPAAWGSPWPTTTTNPPTISTPVGKHRRASTLSYHETRRC